MRGANQCSEIWLPVTEPEERFDPHFEVNVTLAKPRGFARDWLPRLGTWEAENLMDHLHRVIRYEVLPQFNQFLQRPIGVDAERPGEQPRVTLGHAD